MAAQPFPLSSDEFHRLYANAEPAYEYWFGVAIQKPMPTLLHGIVQLLIAMWLERAGWNTASEVRLNVVPAAEPVPDLIAVRGKFAGSYPKAAPELCVEILSPGDRLAAALQKAQTYVAWGSRMAWIVDPEKRTAWTVTEGKTEWIHPGGTLTIEETSIELGALFAEVDRKLELAAE